MRSLRNFCFLFDHFPTIALISFSIFFLHIQECLCSFVYIIFHSGFPRKWRFNIKIYKFLWDVFIGLFINLTKPADLGRRNHASKQYFYMEGNSWWILEVGEHILTEFSGVGDTVKKMVTFLGKQQNRPIFPMMKKSIFFAKVQWV